MARWKGLVGLWFLLVCAMAQAQASPWAEVGDNQVRGDIELLQAAGIVSIITIHWPLPWVSLARQVDSAALAGQPDAVRAAVARLRVRAARETSGAPRVSVFADATNRVSTVYGFDGMGRGDGQAQVSLEGASGRFSGRLNVGLITSAFGGKPNKLTLDDTYGAVTFAALRFYAGYLDHWWGPGEISALQLSSNARAMPQIGFSRSSSAPSSWPVLNLLGPWHFEFFLAKMDGPQIQSNVYYNAAHLTISPLPGLELGVAKTEQFCGQGHPCAPLRDYFRNIDFSTHPNNVNGEGSFELKFSRRLWGVPFQLYAQIMNEDYSIKRGTGSSHLAGASIFLPTGSGPLKLTAEYTDSIATLTLFSFDDRRYGYSYNDYQYPDGMHYRGRTLGFSLDSDSTLASLQAGWTDPGGRFYELSLHHAVIGNSHVLGTNTVSSSPVLLNLAEARVSLPFDTAERRLKVDFALRVQDDQPRPARGASAAAELALRFDL